MANNKEQFHHDQVVSVNHGYVYRFFEYFVAIEYIFEGCSEQIDGHHNGNNLKGVGREVHHYQIHWDVFGRTVCQFPSFLVFQLVEL